MTPSVARPLRRVVVIAGPNGAGKSTVAPRLLKAAVGEVEFVNADAIAQGLAGLAPESAAIAAGRVMLARLHELSQTDTSFAFETTLSTRSFAPWLARLRERGDEVHLYYISLPSATMAVRRVADRVSRGGHTVSPEVVRRRFVRSARNFFDLYLPLADRWMVFDNSRSTMRHVASGTAGGSAMVRLAREWRLLAHAAAQAE